jgi:hypothetical protein
MAENFKNIQEVIEQAATLLVEAMKDGSISQDLFATGKLAQSITSQTEFKDGVFGFQIFMEDYGVYQDSGFFRPPGKRPPLEPIINWLQRKRISLKPDPITNKTPTIREVAFLIARKIGRDGADVKARPFIQPAVYSVVNNFLVPKLEEAGVKDIEESIMISIGKNNKMKVT